MLLLLLSVAYAEDMYISSFKGGADITLSPAIDPYNEKNCRIYRSKYNHEKGSGIWKFVKSKHLADKKIYFYSSYNKDADLQYVFVKYKRDASCEF